MRTISKTILVVDDDAAARAAVGAALARRGYQVRTATHGAEGVRSARRLRPDLILLHLHTPGMDGWDAARHLRADPETRDIPICAVSASDLRPEERERARRLDLERFLRRPLDPDRVVAEVEAWIGPPGRVLAPVRAAWQDRP